MYNLGKQGYVPKKGIFNFFHTDFKKNSYLGLETWLSGHMFALHVSL